MNKIKIGDFLKLADFDIDNFGQDDMVAGPDVEGMSEQEIKTLISGELMRAQEKYVDEVFNMLKLHLNQPVAKESSGGKMIFISNNLSTLNKDKLVNIYNLLTKMS
jgi:hypothetical protein